MANTDFLSTKLKSYRAVLALVIVLSLSACSSSNPDAEDAKGVTTGEDLSIEGGDDTEAKEGGDAGSRSNPIAKGAEAAVGPEWRVKVIGGEPNASASIAKANQFNDPPPAGGQFFMANVELTYIGEGSSSPMFDVTFKAVGQGNVTYDPFENRCGVIPAELPNNEIFSGGKVSGNVCWAINSADADSLLMVVDTGMIDQSRGFFALK